MPKFDESNLKPTAILDYESPPLRHVIHRLDRTDSDSSSYLQSIHRFLCKNLAPVYTVDELQPASKTWLKGKGSCSQRFACLEAFARARGIPTRVRALWIDGRFWGPRFRFARPFIPRRILLAWPQFYLDERWVGVDSLFAPLDVLARRDPRGFANDSESLFDAVAHLAVDFDGTTAGCPGGQCDLSRFVMADAGVYATRDDLFRAFPLFQRTFRGRAFELIFGGRKSR